MRPIKFRGQQPVTGKIVYGDLLHLDGDLWIKRCEDSLAAERERDYFGVMPESVAQLIGYDADGKEIYEGDKVIDKDGDELTATFVSGSFYVLDDDYTDMSHLKLKE